MTTEVFDGGTLLSKELEGWKEVALALRKADSECEEHLLCVALLNSARAFYRMGWWDDALLRFEDSLELQGKVFGTEHPNCTVTSINIADVYRSKGLYDEALKRFEECRIVLLKVLGTEHPSYLTTLHNIAGVYESKGLYDEALKRYEECRVLQLKMLGSEHPDYLTTLHNIAGVYVACKQFSFACPLLQECVATGRKINFHLVEEWEIDLKVVETQLQLQQPKIVAKKVGRNDPCSCGSKKKHKNCCGKM